MDDRYGHPPEDEAPKDPAEGVRIIGAEEAAEALERAMSRRGSPTRSRGSATARRRSPRACARRSASR